MSFIDILLIVIVSGFVFFGLFFGLIHTLGSLVGAILGVFFAARLVEPAYGYLGVFFGGGAVGKVITFIIIFLIVSRLIGLLFWIAEKFFGFLTIIPFAKSINGLLGGLFGFIEGVIVVGVVLFYALQVLPESALVAALETSFVAKYLIAIVGALKVLFPQVVTAAAEQAS